MSSFNCLRIRIYNISLKYFFIIFLYKKKKYFLLYQPSSVTLPWYQRYMISSAFSNPPPPPRKSSLNQSPQTSSKPSPEKVTVLMANDLVERYQKEKAQFTTSRPRLDFIVVVESISHLSGLSIEKCQVPSLKLKTHAQELQGLKFFSCV